jgi:hypothetical protein
MIRPEARLARAPVRLFSCPFGTRLPVKTASVPDTTESLTGMALARPKDSELESSYC